MNDNEECNSLTFRELIARQQLSGEQALVVSEGLRWASLFGLLRHPKWNMDDVRTALILSIIVEEARSTK